MWGCKPILRSLVNYLKKRTNTESIDLLLSCFLKELNGDYLQNIQLCASLEYITKKEPAIKIVSLSNASDLMFIDTSDKSPFSLFHGKVQAVFKNEIIIYYGRYNCLHSPLVSEKEVSVMVEEFNLSFPFQRTATQALLNIPQKKRGIIC